MKRVHGTAHKSGEGGGAFHSLRILSTEPYFCSFFIMLNEV